MPDLSKFQKNGKFLMLAFDHRGSFKKLMSDNPDSVSDQDAVKLKKEIIDSLRGEFSALLIDKDTGLPAFEPKDVPFLMPLEKSGYEVTGEDRITELQYTVEELKSFGASGAKLLVFYNPDGKTAKTQIEVARKVMDECKLFDFPYFLEIRTYKDNKEADKMEEGEREEVILKSLKDFIAAGIKPDVYKLEYPGSALGCQTFTAILEDLPWILLTMGDTFENFTKQLEEASIRGCKGFLAGRAVWADGCRLKGEEKKQFLENTLPERFKKINEIITKEI